MSRVGKAPIELPKGVDVKIESPEIKVKGPKGDMTLALHPTVSFEQEENTLTVVPANDSAIPMAATFRSLVNNMVVGVSDGFEKKLTLVGVGYRAKAQGKKLNLSLGFSHPVDYIAPEGITISTPTQTEILVAGADKQRVGQLAATIRASRKAEPYQGKGWRYLGEEIRRKAGKAGKARK